jgi:uncharacterized protein (TIGR03437 family)
MRARSHLFALVSALALFAFVTPLPPAGRAQTPSAKNFRPDRGRALASRTHAGVAPTRPDAYTPQRKRTDGQTRGLSGATQAEANTRGVRVTIDGLDVPVLSFHDSKIHLQVPQALGTGLGSVVVNVNGIVTAADDVDFVNANPGLFTVPQTGTGEAVALLVSGLLYTRAPFAARTDTPASEVALFGTGWRNALPVTVQIGGKAAQVNYAGPSGGFPGLDQINASIPDGVTGPAAVVVTTAGGATSRDGVFITVQQ